MKRALISTLIGTVVVLSISGCEDKWKNSCIARGGFIKSDTVWSVMPIVGGDGHVSMAVTSTTVRYCIINGVIRPEDIDIS